MSAQGVLEASLLSLVDRFGYFGIAGIVFVESFGVPAPGETAITAIIHRYRAWAIAAAVLALAGYLVLRRVCYRRAEAASSGDQ